MATGEASGIGLATVEALLTECMRVMVDHDEEALRTYEERPRARGGSVRGVGTDVAEPEVTDRSAIAAVAQVGTLNVAVDNAETVAPGFHWELSIDAWRSVIDVGLRGVIHGIRSNMPRIPAAGRTVTW